MALTQAEPTLQALEIVFADDDLVIVSKPPGMHSVDLPDDLPENLDADARVTGSIQSSRMDSGAGLNDHCLDDHCAESAQGADLSVARMLRSRVPECAEASVKLEDGGLVNRLDRASCGLLVAAKSRAVWTALRAQMDAGEWRKSYSIVVQGLVEEPLEIRAPIGSAYRRGTKVSVYRGRVPRGARALPAESRYEPLGVYSPSVEGTSISLLRAHASQARRHQVRAHAAALGHPLWGDSLYGSTRSLAEVLPEFVSATGAQFFLFADRLSFPHPAVGKARISIELPLPATIRPFFGARI